MFEGENRVTFSKETAKKLLSEFLSNLFGNPIIVTEMESDYKGLTLDFTVKAPVIEEKKVEDADARSKIND